MRPLVKVCGVTTPAAALHAARADADFVGIVLVPTTPRFVPDDRVAAIAGAAHDAGARVVAVTMDLPVDRLLALADRHPIDILQLHGDEPVDVVQALARAGVRIWKALRVGPAFDPALAVTFTTAGAEAILLDAWHPTLVGGTGRPTDRAIAAAVASEHRVVLAGGLSPANVADAVAAVRPWAVDASSGLESAPGVKDPALVARYITAARERP